MIQLRAGYACVCCVGPWPSGRADSGKGGIGHLADIRPAPGSLWPERGRGPSTSADVGPNLSSNFSDVDRSRLRELAVDQSCAEFAEFGQAWAKPLGFADSPSPKVVPNRPSLVSDSANNGQSSPVIAQSVP